jgi:predicted DNA-binding ribbon-helix-helix protein
MIRKRSISLQGHPTSVSLEDAYWAELKRMAGDSGLSLAALLEGIDRRRESLNLSSALRLAVLEDLKAQLADGDGGNQDPSPPG